ncbi:MAG: adenylate kinase [Dehalococcoidia bacterium]|nr:adenylate kinase [Dehalococcoidia bacterium]MCA9849547.1 adenylate kinase [Dehalococcoidia bacterium]MCB1733730.1 adenylate kinase [Gammaproteobacteria bacterium]MCB9483213.1 adenylate kinase [Dehalococcoidia bacterium]MCB9492353.1 adenylate kinase [Dehalococcoidia bacterium]
MRLILLGLPGAGKGTQAKILAKEKGLLHISTGDMFREAAAEGTELGLKAQEFMKAGALVPDEVTIGMLLERIEKPDAQVGLMLDGFPRTIPQAEALDAALAKQGSQIDAVLYIVVPESELMERLTGRWSCSQCGAIYHNQTKPPKAAGVCDECGGKLTQRADDQPDTVKARLDTNRAWTEQLADFYSKQGKLHEIDGTGDPSDITKRLLSALEGVSAGSEKA